LTREDENNEAFERLLDERESNEKLDMNRYRYFEDLYNNQYRWWTHRQEDGKFKAEILTLSSKGGWGIYKSKSVKHFRKRKDAKSWAMKHYLKAKENQKGVLRRRVERKQERLDAKPTYSEDQIRVMDSKKQIHHYEELIKRADIKIRSAETRKNTYEKRIRVMQRRIDKVEIKV